MQPALLIVGTGVGLELCSVPQASTGTEPAGMEQGGRGGRREGTRGRREREQRGKGVLWGWGVGTSRGHTA